MYKYDFHHLWTLITPPPCPPSSQVQLQRWRRWVCLHHQRVFTRSHDVTRCSLSSSDLLRPAAWSGRSYGQLSRTVMGCTWEEVQLTERPSWRSSTADSHTSTEKTNVLEKYNLLFFLNIILYELLSWEISVLCYLTSCDLYWIPVEQLHLRFKKKIGLRFPLCLWLLLFSFSSDSC